MKNCGPPLVGRGLIRCRSSAGGDLVTPHELEQRRQSFVGPDPASPEVETEVVVLLSSMPDAQNVRDPAPADDVENGDVLG